MRVLITDADENGRSCVREEMTPSIQPFMEGTGITLAFAASTGSSPPPPGLPGKAPGLGASRTPGVANWYFIDFPPGETTPYHHTDSLDFDVVLSGSIDVLLDDGPHRLACGDAVVLKGVDHAWRTHDEPCRMSVVVVATPPPEGPGSTVD